MRESLLFLVVGVGGILWRVFRVVGYRLAECIRLESFVVVVDVVVIIVVKLVVIKFGSANK